MEVVPLTSTPEFWCVGALGAVVGATELMGRYRDEPFAVFRCFYAGVYVAFNILISWLSLFVLDGLNISFESVAATGDAPQRTADFEAVLYNVIAAGLGGAAFFRSSLMKVKTSGTDVAVGPALVIDTLLAVTDREVDRFRARDRATRIARLMAGLGPQDISMIVMPFCRDLMQNLSDAERQGLTDAGKALDEELTKLDSEQAAADSATDVKALGLGLEMAGLVGFGVLDAAITALRNEGKLPPHPATMSDDQERRWKFWANQKVAGDEAAPVPGTAAAPSKNFWETELDDLDAQSRQRPD